MKPLILVLELVVTLVVSLPFRQEYSSGKFFLFFPRKAPPYKDIVDITTVEYALGSRHLDQAYIPLEKKRERTESLFQPNPGILPCLSILNTSWVWSNHLLDIARVEDSLAPIADKGTKEQREPSLDIITIEYDESKPRSPEDGTAHGDSKC